MAPYSYVLTLSCPDKLGIVHAVTGFLKERSANITEAAQHNDTSTGLFFMRMRFACTDIDAINLRAQFAEIAQLMAMKWEIHSVDEKVPTFIMVSKLGHCLNDLLFRYRSNLLPLDIRGIVSNHRDFYQMAASYNIPFHHIPVDAQTKPQAEAQLLDLLAKENIELVVLARYMQVLSDDVCRRLDGRVINIHHSFLPSFKGARPYDQAFERGVKIIGATAHYVTADLDEGPIIEQDIARANHSMSPARLTNMGRDIESAVLARAVTWHAERRVLLNGRKTVVFN
jgi:formyltetrahydrofolate deformylase